MIYIRFLRLTKIISMLLVTTILNLFYLNCSKNENPTDPEDKNPEEMAFNGIAVSETNNPEIPLVAIHQDGSRIAVLSDVTENKIKGAVFISKDNESFTVWFGDDGLPSKAFIKNTIILFDNYNQSQVDIAIIDSQNQTTIYRGINSDFIEQLRQFNSDKLGKVTSEFGLSIGKTLRYIGLSLSVASCATAIVLSSGMALPCLAAIVNVAVAFIPDDDPALEASSAALGAFASSLGCISGEPFSCASWIADGASAVVGLGEVYMAGHQNQIEEAKTELVGKIDLENGLLAYYPFNSNANDESGNNYDGSVQRATLTTDKNGNSNKAFHFDGSTANIKTGINLKSLSAFTVNCWVLLDESAIPHNNVVWTTETASSGCDFDLHCNIADHSGVWRAGFQGYRGGGADYGIEPVSAENTITPNSWTMITCIKNSSGLRLYVNGILTDESSAKVSTVTGTDFWLGAHFKECGWKSLKGKIDEVRVYDRALTGGEVQAMYQN